MVAQCAVVDAGGRDRCTLLIHPEDALRIGGVGDGELAEVSTSEGKVAVPVEVSDDMMPGVVSLPHGWGHGVPGSRLGVANEHPGVNSNLLNPPDLLDMPSNTQVVNGGTVPGAPDRLSRLSR